MLFGWDRGGRDISRYSQEVREGGMVVRDEIRSIGIRLRQEMVRKK